MREDPEFETDFAGQQGVFDIASIEPRSERWHQLAQLAVGVGAIWLGHETASWASDPAKPSVRLWTLAVVVFGVIQVGRAMSRFFLSVSSRQARIFRCRHLAACGVCLLVVVVALTSSLLARGPLLGVLSHGSITGTDIADVGFVLAAGLCLVGAITAFIAAFEHFRSQRAWQHQRFRSPLA